MPLHPPPPGSFRRKERLVAAPIKPSGAGTKRSACVGSPAAAGKMRPFRSPKSGGGGSPSRAAPGAGRTLGASKSMAGAAVPRPFRMPERRAPAVVSPAPRAGRAPADKAASVVRLRSPAEQTYLVVSMYEDRVTVRSGDLDAAQQIPADKTLSVLKEHVFSRSAISAETHHPCETFAMREVAVAESNGFTTGTCPCCSGPGGMDPSVTTRLFDQENPEKLLCKACHLLNETSR